jgi:UDP-N-acetylglucosamine diphosphorylase/glucosamine-1-phosphate N-acetyltransferase
MAIFLNDSNFRNKLFPFTEVRHTADIRVGILTIKEKWQYLGINISGSAVSNSESGVQVIPANIIPTLKNYQKIIEDPEHGLANNDNNNDIKTINYAWDICQLNDWAIRHDFELISRNRASQPISNTNRCVNEQNIFIEEGASVECSIINASEGPVYIGRNVQVMEGCMIRGPFAICNDSVLKMGTKIYGGTTIGPWCIAGGEIKNSVLMGFSNKAHDGYLGDSVIGEWCNLGAGTSNSNVKNTAGNVVYKLKDVEVNAGFKAGLMMGDYSKAAINTSFNTGSIVGICCNIFERDFPPKYIPNFSWGNDRYKFEKLLQDIQSWKKFKNSILSEAEIRLLHQLYLNE